MEHTPGPWTAEGERIHGHAPPATRLGLHLATVHEVDGLRATLDANARLIAAAPELLEALEKITDTPMPSAKTWMAAINKMRMIGRAAIKAAK